MDFQHLVSRAPVLIQAKNNQERSRTIVEEEFTMVVGYGNANYPASLPILKVDNYENWCKQMKVLFRYQGLWDLIKDEVKDLEEDASEEEKQEHAES